MKTKPVLMTVALAALLATLAAFSVQRAVSYEKMLKKPKAEFCFMCHADKKDVYMKNGHGQFDMTCDMCHNPHGTGNEKMLSKPAPDLCYQCHGDMKDHFSGSEHGEADVTCSMCHDAHGTPDQAPAKK